MNPGTHSSNANQTEQNHAPLISVVMPVYNGERHLAQAVESILSQTFSDFEFIAVTDPSKDRSLEILQEYAKKDSRIRIVANRLDKNISGALNTGIEEAKGKYIARMDCDDISLTDRFKKQIEFLESNPNVGVCATNGRNMTDDGIVSDAQWWKQDLLTVNWRVQFETPMAHPTVIMRMSVLKENNIRYAAPPAEDFELWTRLSEVTEMVRLEEILFHYRMTVGSLFRETHLKSIERAIDCGKKLAEKRVKRPLPDSFRFLTNFAFDLETKPNWADVKSLVEVLPALASQGSNTQNENNQELQLKDLYFRIFRIYLLRNNLIQNIQLWLSVGLTKVPYLTVLAEKYRLFRKIKNVCYG